MACHGVWRGVAWRSLAYLVASSSPLEASLCLVSSLAPCFWAMHTVPAAMPTLCTGCAFRVSSLEERARDESSNTVEMLARAGASGFKKYLAKVDKAVVAIKHAAKGDPDADAENSAEARKALWASARCGGRGICQIFGPWDGRRPHGVGKAKFLMVRWWGREDLGRLCCR